MHNQTGTPTRKIGLPKWCSPKRSSSTEAVNELPTKFPTTVTIDSVPSPVNARKSVVVTGIIGRQETKRTKVSAERRQRTETRDDDDDHDDCSQVSSITTSLDSNPLQFGKMPATDLDGLILTTSTRESVTASIYDVARERLQRRNAPLIPSEGLKHMSLGKRGAKVSDIDSVSSIESESEGAESSHQTGELREELRRFLQSNIASAVLDDKNFQCELIQLFKRAVIGKQQNDGMEADETNTTIYPWLLFLILLGLLRACSMCGIHESESSSTHDSDLQLVFKMIEYENGV